MSKAVSVLFVRPTLGQGGADRVTLTVLQHLDRARFLPQLALLRAEGEWLEQLPRDVPVHELGVRRVRHMIPALRRLMGQSAPQVVFSTASGTNVPVILAARLSTLRPRVVISERSIVFNGGKTMFRRAESLVKRACYPMADAVTAVCGGVADDLARTLGLARDRIHVLNNPSVPDNLLELSGTTAPHPWLEPGNQTVIAVGRLLPVKGYDVLLHAFAKVVARSERARLLILGDGPLLADLESLAADLALSAAVRFVGFQKNPFAWLSRASVFALASHNEGLCNAVIEAQAVGLPVVITDCSAGQRELVSHGHNGLLVPTADSEALALGILKILGDGRLATDLGMAGRASSQQYAVAQVILRYQQAIELAAGRGVSQDAA